MAGSTDVEGSVVSMTDETADALLSRLALIEQQPLDQRATAFEQLHDALQATLEGGDQAPSRG